MHRVNETTKTNYKVRAFTNPNDPDFLKALRIYSKYINSNDLTDTNQITFCLSNYNDVHKTSDFVICGFYQNNQLIGYCQFIYISDQKLIFIDYIVIDELYRGIGVFYCFIEKINELVEGRGYEVKYVAGEINLNSKVDDIPVRTKMLVKLLKSNNFGEVKSLYIQPMLGLDNYESEQKSILMLYPANQYDTIKRETYLKIVETIYFKHYERWYRFFLDEGSMLAYTKHLHEVFQKVNEKAVLGKLITIDRDDLLYGETDIRLQTANSNPKKGILLIFGFVGLLILLLSISLILKHAFSIDLKNQMYLLLAASCIYLIILSLFSEKASKLLNQLLEKVIDKLT